VSKKPPRTRGARKTAVPPLVEQPTPVAYLSESEAGKRLGIEEHVLHQFALIWVADKPEDMRASRKRGDVSS
jgi:hypothetical protein